MNDRSEALNSALKGLETGSNQTWDSLSERFGFKPRWFSAGGGMLYWKALDLLLLVTHPKGGKIHDYGDRWDPGTRHLLYVGKGLKGDQKMRAENLRLKKNDFAAACVLRANGPKQFVFLGLAHCVEPPVSETSPGQDGAPRQQFRFRLALDSAETTPTMDWVDPANQDFESTEGNLKKRWTTVRERNPKARQACIDYWGYKCVVCGMSFGEKYGDLGEGFIHVHHLLPIADSDGERQVDPVEELRPVCPNCHAMLHRKRPPLSIQELQKHLGHSLDHD